MFYSWVHALGGIDLVAINFAGTPKASRSRGAGIQRILD